MTLEEQLASVQKAIQHIEAGGQEYEIEVTTTDGSKSKRKMTRAQLKTLYSREKELLTRLNRERSPGHYRIIL